MAEKRVSVRLAAVGGKQVRAELEGVGDAGVKGFGRMSKEAEIANARLAAFSTRVKIAAAVAVAAAAAAGIAMIRSGLQTIDAQANLAQSLGTTTRSIQVLTFAGDLAGVSMDEIAAATKKLTLKLSDAASGTGTAVDALQRLHLTATDLQALPLDERIVAIQDALAKFVAPAERAAVASALFGDKAAIAFSRIDSATLRQASQDITDFGVAVSDQDADQIRTAGDAIDRLGLVWLGLTNQLTVAVAPALEMVANALADATRVGGVFQTSISFLGDHIGEIASITGAFAAFFAGRFVIALGAAALGVSGFSLSLTVLKGALIRTGIGALIVGAGELAYQFSKLVEGAGGFGAALGLLSDLASEVWDRIGLGVDAVVASLQASWSGITATVADAMQGALEAVVGFGNSSAGVFQGAYDAMKAIWGALPAAIGDFAFQAANGLISGVEAMLNGVVTRINTFISGLNAALDMLPDWATGEGGIQIGTLDPVTLGRVGNPFEGAATATGAAAADAFQAAMGETYLQTPDLGLGTMADDARARADGYREASGMLSDAAIIDGRWDTAEVELWRVNWADTSQRVLLRRGAVGQIRRGRMAFVAEVRSLAHVLGQTVGRTFQASCDAALGDARCGIDLENATYKGSGVIKRTLTASATSALYTAAQQIADCGVLLAPGSSLDIRIYQLSALIGRGAPRAVTLTF